MTRHDGAPSWRAAEVFVRLKGWFCCFLRSRCHDNWQLLLPVGVTSWLLYKMKFGGEGGIRTRFSVIPKSFGLVDLVDG
jgi:hypothetical protein